MRYTKLSSFILCLLLAACTKRHEPEICHGRHYEARIAVAFKGYAKDELDTIITERYTRGSNFMQLVDTVMVIDSDFHVVQDTTLRRSIPGVYYKGFANLLNDYDYRIVVPSTNTSYRIADISFPGDSTYSYTAGMHGCTEAGPIFRFCDRLTLDNQPVVPSTSFTYPSYDYPWSSVSMLYLNR